MKSVCINVKKGPEWILADGFARKVMLPILRMLAGFFPLFPVTGSLSLFCFLASAQPAGFLPDSLRSPRPHLDDGVDGEGQESLGLVEDVENREGHEGFLGVHGVLLGHQSMHSKDNQCHLGETRVVTLSC